ncbi:MAG: hypothetical protein JO349_05245, partial [Candidatus Eremiobacteraeota bacterium]|nr:hypothetical protein [Candidatus Eremiobacteraeota bacterium]
PQTTTVGGLQVVQAGAASLGFTLSIPGTSLSAGATLPVTIAHSAVYLVANNGGPLSVYAFFDGNTTPSYTFYNAGTSFLGINTDINGNVWVADSYNNKVPMWSNPQPGTVPGENDGTTTGIAYPQVIAFDISGNAFVGNCGVLQCIGAGPFALDEYYAPAPASTPNFSAVGFQNYSDASHIPYAIAVDINDFIYISRWNDVNGTVDKYQPGNASILATLVTQASPEYGLGLVPGGNLGVLLSSAMIEFVNRTTGTPGATISSGALTSAQGMAVDSLGNAWAPNFSSGGATEWIYPAYSTTKTIGSAAQSGPVSIAVWPNSLIGEDAIVGVPPPQTPMPYPIPTPT